MYLEIEIDESGGRGRGRERERGRERQPREAEEDEEQLKMRLDRRPERDTTKTRLLRRRHRHRRARLERQSDGSASFLRAARAGNLEKVLEFLKTNTDINTCNANGLNALHLASKEGHVNVVRELLQRGANVDAATKKGNTALHIASLAGQEEIVKVLVQHQALVNIQSQNGFTPLYMAAQENHDSVVRFLLANNANQSLATEDGFTPLAVALQQGHDKVVAVLLENDTRGKVRLPALHIAAKKDDTKAAALLLHTDHNPDVTSKSGFTPLHIASHYGNENIANLLIQRGADVNYIAKHQITPLHVASKWGKGNMVSLLIDKGANYEAKTRDGLTPLHCAARSGHEAVVDMLLEKGAPITSKTKNGLAPLHMASQGDHVDAARILLYHKAPVDDVTVDFLTALHVAAHCGHVRVAKLLLDRKAEANARALNGFTPLHIACKKNRIKVVELLLKHGASIEATTESGLTPLHVASFMGCMNIVIYLLQHSATADVPTVRGETPLHLAARANQTDIIRILLRNGAQVDARAREQQTALHIASRLGNSDIVVLLLQHGAAVDATTKDHYTALHIAAKEGQEEVASVLLEHGASLTSTTKKGFTPLHLAAKYGNMKVARLLLQKDALVDAQGKNGVTPLHVAAHYDHQNVALLLLDKGASPHATAKNGYTPLHIAARKNQMDIATTLLEYGASANAESKAGFTPLHLSSQEGHTDMATLLIEHNAAPGACAKNGLTPLHLCGQEDRVNVAAILVKHGAQIDPVTKAGYTPLHVACHFGQMNMVRFLLQHGAKVNSTTQLGYTPLHQAAQQGHTQIVNLLLENKAEPNTETNDGKTALSIAQRLGYISVVETLKIVTETTINTTTTTTTEEKYKVVVPETMHETFMSESEDEGGDDTMVSSMFGKPQHVTLPYYEGQFRYTSDDTMLGDQSYRYLTVDEMKSLGDDSLPIDVTKDEKMDMSFSSNQMAAPPVAPADHLSPQHQKEHYAQMTASYPADNVDVGKTPILAGPESLNTTLNTTIDSAMIEAQIEPQIIQTKLAPQQMVENSTDLANSGSVSEKAAEILNGWEGFLVSFMVDARGGAMRGCRHSGVRVIIPPRKAAMPMRVTCRYLKKDKLVHAPPLMEGEALASRILEMGPAGAKFLGPVIIEVPHFASLRGKEREIVILRSDNGETWREHTLEATEEAVQEVLNESFDGEELKQLEDLNTNRITRILTTDFPQYFAIVTRIRQEVHAIGPEGGMVSSTVVPQVQAVFPQGALTKKIKVGLQAQPIPTDLVAKLLGNRVAVSPIVTVEPRRRKFHKPITLTIPVPQASSKGMINQYSGEAPTLRLLCSITGVFRKRSLKGGTTRAQWEDVTGSTPLTFVNDCVSFTTTVSARFWLMDCSNIPEATKMATELYREAIHVPFMAKFVVFSKRHQLEEARMRVFCMTDDREDKTLEHQELFVEVAKSRDVEVLEGKPQFLEFAGNLVPVTKSGDQLAFNFYAFRENRLPFTVRVKDQHADPIGRVAFMRQPKVGRGDPPQTPICNLNIALPDNIQPEPAPSEPDLLALEKKYSFLSISKADTIHRANLRLTDISNMLGTDWVALAHELEVTDSDINIIKSQYPDNAPQQAIVMLRLWMQTAGNKASGNTVGKALRKINREDIVKQCIFNVEVVTDDIERAMAKAHFDQSGFDTFKDELGPSRDATLNRDVSLDVSYDEQDMMKEAESAEEEEENQRAYHDKSSREQHTADLSPTYESEEKKYAGEEKVVTDEKVTKEEAADDSTTFTSFTATSTPIKKDTKEEEKLEAEKKDKASKPTQIVPDTLQESKEQTTVTDKDAKKPAEESVTKESISKEQPESVEKGKPATIVKEEIKEKEIDTTPVVKEKVELEEKKKEDEKPEASQKEPEKTVTSTTKTEVVGGPGDVTTVTTETKSYTTADDGSVQEHIVVKKQTTKVVDGKEMEEDKSAILQKLGEELGKLDEQLEEKFKKRKAEKPEDGFTQASVESSQMSSTRGTADVSFPGADTAVKQLDGGTHEASQPTEHQTSLPEEQDVGVVFTERKEYGGGVKTSAETTGGHSHISPSPVLHPSQSIQSSSSTSFQQKLPCTTSVNVEDSQSSHDEPHVPSRPSRRHERTFSQATNIFTGAIPTETKVESKKVEDIKEEQIGITEDIKPYSERKQFWESVTSQSFESKSSHLLKSETESDTDTTGTDGTVLEQKVRKTKVSSTESNDSESEYLAQRVDPRFYENAGFAGTEKIDVSTESARERTISPFEVLRSEEPTDELPSPEDIAFKDVSSKRALFEKEIKRQSMEIEESQSWKRSSKEYDETLVVSEETASSTLKKKEERESKISETIEKDKEIKKKFESKKDDLSKTDFKTEITSKSDKLSSVEDRSEVTESSKLHQEKMQKKEEKVTSELGALGKKSVTQRDASTEKREKEVSEKEAKIIHEKKDSYSRTFSKSVSKSEEKTESSSEAKETVHTLSTDDQDTSKDEMTEEDITRTEETSDEEPEEKLAADKTTVDVTEESRQLGDTRETVVRETTTTREGDQEQRVVKETKTQETAMADGSTIKTTSITTFTTQLETKDQEEPKPYSAKTAKEKAEAYVKQQMKSDIFSEELSSSAEDQSPEHKVLTPKDTIAPVSREQKSHPLSSPILVPEEKIEDVVWEVSQERSETVLSETVEDIPVQQSYETQHVRDLSSDESRVLEKPQPEQATEATKHKLSEEEARKLAIEIVEEVKTEAVKRSPLVTPSQTFQEFPQEPEDTTDGATQPSLPIPIPESAFTQETTSKIEKYIQEQLGEEVDEKQLKLIESVTAKKTELLHRKLVGGQYQQSMEITDEDLRSSGAELSPIEHHMERLRQMTEEEDNQRYAREPSEADESESSIIIHDTVDDVISSEYDQATQMISKTLDSIKTADISRIERPIDTIEELPETPVMPIVEVKERKMSEVQEVARFSDSDIKETARQIVKEVTEIAKESEAVKQASQAADLKQAPGSQDQAKSCSPKSGSKPGSRKGSWMDDEDLTREFRKDYEDKKKMFKEEMTSDKSDASDAKDDGAVKVKHQKSSESQKEVPMESSMTESMEESSAVESIRSIEGKLKQEIVPEIREGETEKKHEERSSSSHEEVVMRKKTHIEEFSRRSGADFDTYSSSGESHYFTAAEGTSDSRTASRPCSSDVEALMSERTGTSEYDTALTSQDTSQYSSYSSSSREYRTAASSMSSRDSMKSIDSESSGNLASVELSEASETLVPSALELERDMDLLDQEIMEEDQSHSTQAHPSIIPQLTVQSDTPKSEGVPCAFDLESDEGESEPEVKEKEHHVASRMKRSVEMTFHPEPVPIAECKKAGVTGSVASSLEESTLSEMSVVTVVERERSLQGSFHSESSMTASAVSEQMASSSEGQPAAHPITRTDSGVLTTDTGDGDMALHSVTITATSVPSTTDSSTASMCTQVTSETRSQAELTESEQFFHANGPTEVDYVPEYDDEVRGVRPVAAPALPPVQEVSGAVAGPSEGPQKVTVVEECYETEADQEYGQMMRESEYSDMAEAELQYSLEEQPESEMSNMLGIEEPIERPKTPEPGYVPSSRPSHITAQSLDESEEFTEVDKRFSAIFSTTYEEREEGARSLVPGLSVDIPDIRVTEHTLPMPSQYCYPDLEREEDFPECQVQAEVDASGQDVPATPGSQESASTCASRKSSSTDSEQGREYCLDDAAQGLPFESFEMVEAGDIEDFLEYEKTLRMHEKRMLEMSQIQEEEEEEVEEEQKVHTSPIMPSQLKAVKLEAKSLRSSDSQSQVSDEGSEEADSTIEEQRRWLELQFEESSVSNFEYSQPPYMQHVYSGPLEDIEEEKEDAERRDLSHVVKGSSLSSTPEYDVLAGRKFFTRSGEHDDVSMSSLQEFENLERAVAVDAVARRSSSGSQESLNGRKPEGKSGQGDDISVGSFASLQEFERLEEECLEAEKIEKKAKEEEAMLSEIEEGHESQVSESESCETMSEPGQASVDGEEYDQRMFEIDEIIRQAQTNVEKFDKTKPGYEGVQLQDIVSNGSGSSRADRTPSVGREEGDADSLEEAQLPELDLDQSAPGATSTKQDVMTLSTDSIETSAKQKVPRETSQDSLEKVATRTSDPMATSVDSIDLASRHDPMTTSIDSLEGRRRGQDPMSASTDSIDPYRRDVMATSIDSLGKDDSSGRDADISSGSEQVRPLPRDGLMEWSTDSLEPTSSQATHAIYHQYDTDSVMSGSFASGCSNTLVASTEGLPDMMTSSMYLPEGELPPLEGEEQHTHYVHTSSGSAAETVAPSAEPGFSHSITRVVKLPPEAHQVTFTGPDAQKKLEEYIKGFNAGQHSVQDETVDEQGNVHIRRVTQTRIVAEPDQTQEHGFSVSEPSTVETEECDEHGNVTRVIRRTVVTSHTIEVDLDTGEPIVQPSSSTPSKSSTSASTSTFSPSISRIPRPVTSPPQSRSQQPGPPPGLRGPCEPVPPSLEPNTVSGLDVEEMSSGMEGYASDGNDPMTTTHITRYDPDPLPITTSTTTTTTTTTTTRIIRRTKEEDGEVKEEEEIFEEY
ncbi:ankyrin-2-like isoform X44 [Scylla paramamosain]|uniref:ankyrin-2-like isoform X44 n=1 Tax=Scylla paramamosain TaxID=85552 RepID=UPI0030827685